jgi:dihydroorotase
VSAARFDLLVRGGVAVTPAGVAAADIGISGGRIAGIGDLGRADAAATIDAAGLHVLPGVIDTQVHFREPGSEHKEDLATGTRGAVLGGVTAVFEMPNTNPSTLTAAQLDDKLARAAGRAWCEHAFFIGAAADNAAELGRLERLPGCCGVKVFMGSSTGGLLVEDDKTLAAVLAHGTRRVAVHAEDEPRLRQRRKLAEDGKHPRFHPVWRDEETAIAATRRLLQLARYAGRRVHVLHVTTAEEMDLLAESRDIATVEVTPQHLTLAAPDCYDRLGTLAQMNPPIRDGRHRDALWRALAAGVVDVIGSDHAPHTRAEKAKPYPASPSGMPGVQTTLPLMLDHVHAGRLTLERLVDLLCHGPQRIYQIAAKGRLMLGYDGDLTLVDLKARRTIETKWIASKSGWTAFDGMTVTGWPAATIIRGQVVMREGEVLGTPVGRPVRFADCL